MTPEQRAEALRLAEALTGVDTPWGILNEGCEDAAALLRELAGQDDAVRAAVDAGF